MSTLLVIRHGQASFGQADYDKLTDLGVEQAQYLGRWLVANDVRVDGMYVGPRRRQRDTARHMIEASSGTLPSPELVSGLDEYPAEAIMRQALPELMKVDAEARDLFKNDPLAIATDARRFQGVFERVMHRWAAGDLDVGDTETFAAFAGRVRAAVEGIMAATGRGRTVAVVTSAGPTAIATQMALETSDAVALKASWIVANSAVTDLRFRENELTLITFNTTPHLPRGMLTYR